MTKEQLGALEQAINRSPEPQVRQRAIVIGLLEMGLHPEKVAEMVMTKGSWGYKTDPEVAVRVKPLPNIADCSKKRKNSQSFIEFLDDLLVQTYPTQSVILVLENASYHYSAAVRAALSLFAHRIRVFWQPQDCPELNQIERFWKPLKLSAWAIKLYATLDSLPNNVVEVLPLQYDPTTIQRLTFAKYFP